MADQRRDIHDVRFDAEVDDQPLLPFPLDTASPSGLLSFADEVTARQTVRDDDPTLVDLVVLPA